VKRKDETSIKVGGGIKDNIEKRKGT